MAKAAIVVLADTETKEGLGRVANALTSAKEFKEEDHEVTVIFDGAGTKWVGELADPDHKYHGHFESVKDEMKGRALIARRPSASKKRCKRAASSSWGSSKDIPASPNWCPKATR